jgi:hypothetical protein
MMKTNQRDPREAPRVRALLADYHRSVRDLSTRDLEHDIQDNVYQSDRIEGIILEAQATLTMARSRQVILLRKREVLQRAIEVRHAESRPSK